MRSGSVWPIPLVLFALLASTSPRTASVSPVHQQRYSMGTMFDIIVYQTSTPDAVRAVERAMTEIARLDRVMSNFDPDSDLAKLIRDGRSGFTAVEPSLYEVIEESIGFSRRSGGKFDVTIAPVLKTWKNAYEEGRRPSAAEIANALECVGYEKIELLVPDRVRLHSECLEIDLGGIGKGYAIDRALAVLTASGIEHALVNAGGSSIAAIGAPPGQPGWPVSLGEGRLLLRDGSLSTSQQPIVAAGAEPARPGEIIDPQEAAPAGSRVAVTVVAPRATVSDALSTTLVMLPMEEGVKLLAQHAGVSAVWLSASGEIQATYGEPRIQP